MKTATVEVTLFGHEGWVSETVSLPLELSINIDESLVDCRIDSADVKRVVLERPFVAELEMRWDDEWGSLDMRGRVFTLQYGNQVLGQARMLAGLSS